MAIQAPTYSDFVLRRLHSLTGVIPLTFFIFFHFFANSYSTVGEEAFDGVVKQLRGLPFLDAIEWGFLFAPFLFHMLFGVYIISTSRVNAGRMNYGRNWAFVAQRVTAIVVFVFIIYHVVSIRFMDAHNTMRVHAVMHNKLSQPFTYWWYIVGIACTCYHLANGVCTFLMTWGITTGRKAQRFAAIGLTVVGLVLFAVGVSAVNGFIKNKPNPAMPLNVAPGTTSVPGLKEDQLKVAQT